jgi:ubiquinone/menaquinone biosynthesis C-methylase UbiE
VFSESVRLYDAIYGAFKDYAAEAAHIATLVREIHPAAHTVLDVGCGTGEHAKHLRTAHGFAVDGLDLDPGLLTIARQKLPLAQFFEADMSTFAVTQRYDVVMCLFSAIGYLQTLERVTAALTCFRRHLQPGGVVIVEPWFTPGVLHEGLGPTQHAELGGVRVERTSQTMVAGQLSTVVFEYRIEDTGGVRFAREAHHLGLFTQVEMLASFHEAGLAAVYDSPGLSGRGLYIARVAA